MRKWLDKRNLKTLTILAFIALGVMATFIHFSYVFQSLLWKSLTIAAATLFSVLFIFLTNAALQKTNFAKKKARGLLLFLGFLFVILVFFVASYLIGGGDVLLLLPLSALLMYWVYIRGSFIETQPNDSEQVKLRIETLKNYLRERTNLMLMLVLVFAALPVLFIKGIVLPVPTTFGALYSVSLTVYAIIFSVVTAFGVLGLGRDETNSRKDALERPLLGLAHMCVVFFLISLVGTVLGTDVDTSLFATGTTLSKAFSFEPLKVGVIRVLLIESIIISFPFTLVYLYAILRTFLLGSTGLNGKNMTGPTTSKCA